MVGVLVGVGEGQHRKLAQGVVVFGIKFQFVIVSFQVVL
jgi:hypothetical protein